MSDSGESYPEIAKKRLERPPGAQNKAVAFRYHTYQALRSRQHEQTHASGSFQQGLHHQS